MNIIKKSNLLSNLKIFLNSKRCNFQQSTVVELLSHNQDIRTIKKVSSFGFRLNDGTFAVGPIVLFNEVCLSWNIVSSKEINPKSLSLFRMYEPKFEIIVLGVGDDLSQIDPKLIPYLTRNKVPFEIHRTLDAIKLYNYLAQDKRHVAAALVPPIEYSMPSVANWRDDDLTLFHEKAEVEYRNDIARSSFLDHYHPDIYNRINNLNISKEKLKLQIAQKNKELNSKEYLLGDILKEELDAIEEYKLKEIEEPKKKKEFVRPKDDKKLIE